MMNVITDFTPTAGPVPTGASEPVKPKVKVWLVDDDDQLRTLMGELLGLENDIECVRQFASPDELLSALASKPGPDVILLDVQMGDRNGLDAVRPIKSLTRSTRVLMFTTCFNPEWRERALCDGASDYFLKSYELKKVADRIRCPVHDADPEIYPWYQARRSSAPPATAGSARWLSRTLQRLRALGN
jgi:two-component system response regulator DesR